MILHSVPCSQYAESHSRRSISTKQATHRPQTVQKRSLNEVRRIDKEDMAFAGSSRSQQRLQWFVKKFGLSRSVFLDRNFSEAAGSPPFNALQTETCFRSLRTCVNPRLTPIACSIRRHAAAVVRGGSAGNISSREVFCTTSSLDGILQLNRFKPSIPYSR